MSGGASEDHPEYRIGSWAREMRQIDPLISDFPMDLKKVPHACDYVLAGDSSPDLLDRERERLRTRWMCEDGYRERVTNCIWSQIRLVDETLVPEDVLKELDERRWIRGRIGMRAGTEI